MSKSKNGSYTSSIKDNKSTSLSHEVSSYEISEHYNFSSMTFTCKIYRQMSKLTKSKKEGLFRSEGSGGKLGVKATLNPQ